MAKFEFRKDTATLDICGTEYKINIDNTTSELCKNIQKKAGDLINNPDESPTDNAVCDFMIESIELFLGKGSTDIIFANRKKNFLDASDLLNFIIKELNCKQAERVRELECLI